MSGASGYSGAAGSSGISGYSGSTGTSGVSGYSGTGASGFSGYSGGTGTSGISGYSGASAFSGYSGSSGISGYSGTGTSGFSGYSGSVGTSGISGYSGAAGSSGISGYSGTGTSGISGYSGAAGTSGRSGYSGASGVSGFSGYSGPQLFVNVKSFGAVGQGNSDDAPFVQAAVDFIKNHTSPAWFSQGQVNPDVINGAIIYFPPGSYRCDSTIDVYGGMTLRGDRNGSVFWLNSADNNDALINIKPAISGFVGDVTIEDLAINTKPNGYGIVCEGRTDLTTVRIRNCHFRCKNWAIFLDDPFNYGVGVAASGTYCQDVSIVECNFSQLGSGAIALAGNVNQIVRCNVEGTLLTDGGGANAFTEPDSDFFGMITLRGSSNSIVDCKVDCHTVDDSDNVYSYFIGGAPFGNQDITIINCYSERHANTGVNGCHVCLTDILHFHADHFDAVGTGTAGLDIFNSVGYVGQWEAQGRVLNLDSTSLLEIGTVTSPDLFSNCNDPQIRIRTFRYVDGSFNLIRAFTPTQGALALTESGGSVAIDASLAATFTLTLAGNWTISNPTNPTNGQKITIRLTQDGSGNRIATWGSAFRFSAGTPTLSTTPGATDYISFEYNSSDAKWDHIVTGAGAGTSGYSGRSGFSGYSGSTGTSGNSGYSGVSGRSGYSGLSGNYGGDSLVWSFNATTNPSGISSGQLRANDGDPGLATHLYIATTDAEGNDATTWLDTLANSRLKVSQQGASATYALYDVSSVTSNTGYRDLTVSLVNQSAGSFPARMIVSAALKGVSGYSGRSGYSGISGTSGYSGAVGQTGAQGTSGVSGYSGTSGTSGYSGAVGQTGTQGTSGVSGYSGTSGTSGYSGAVGQTGTQGTSGVSGYSGTSGTSGYSGTSGVSGYSGRSGISGYSGAGTSGFSGYSGATSTSGFSGYSGGSGQRACCGNCNGTVVSGNNANGTYVFTRTSPDVWTAGTMPAPIVSATITINGSNWRMLAVDSGDVNFAFTVSLAANACPPKTGWSTTNGTLTLDSCYDGSSGFSGYSGSGSSGFSGYSGATSTSGFSGYSGVSGWSGISGYSGTSGRSGYSGAGTSGFSGYSGAVSTSGFSGYSGVSGWSGVSGYSGTSGRSGYSGAGNSGFSGYSGPSSFPKRGTMWYDAALVTSGPDVVCQYFSTLPYAHYSEMGSGGAGAGDGNTFTMSCALAAGTYTLKIWGAFYEGSPKVDWSFKENGAGGYTTIETGQDWYAVGFGFTQKTTASFTINTGGHCVFKGVVNGKNASSSAYRLCLIKLEARQSAD